MPVVDDDWGGLSWTDLLAMEQVIAPLGCQPRGDRTRPPRSGIRAGPRCYAGASWQLSWRGAAGGQGVSEVV